QGLGQVLVARAESGRTPQRTGGVRQMPADDRTRVRLATAGVACHATSGQRPSLGGTRHGTPASAGRGGCRGGLSLLAPSVPAVANSGLCVVTGNEPRAEGVLDALLEL